ncbi:MAG: lipase, partial [Muribaculaceae bacterium]|nr:lipase [Muribaculaceae bacterium]
RENHIPVYDWYEVAGGDGASTLWIENGLMNTDRIHNTFAGYDLQGDLLYNALETALNPID